MSSLRVAIDARIPDALWGGVQQVVLGLASGLGRFDDADEEFLFLAYDGESRWLEPHLSGNSRLVEVPRMLGTTRRRKLYERMSSMAPQLTRVIERGAMGLGAAGRLAATIPRSDGTLEALGVDLVHFTTQQAFVTDVPSIYQPHDLLHVHLPQQFSPMHVRYRDTAYRVFCNQARVVSVMTDWGRRDLCARFGLAPQKVAVVPWASVASLQPLAVERRAGNASHEAERPFLLYPAQTWEHKNHIRLIEAIGLLRDRGIRVDLVCTGHQTHYYATIKRRVDDLVLDDQIRFVGYVDADRLAELFRTATALVFPSRFEGWGLPVVEAFTFGLPVACSNATVLPDVVGDAALLFDPTDTRGIADAIARIWSDETLRSSLQARGRVRAAEFSWDRTARTFRALYRSIAGRQLTDEDRRLLAPPTLVA